MFIVVNNFYGSTLDCDAEAPLLDRPSLLEVIADLTTSLESLCRAGRKIPAIKAYRKAVGCGLKEAKMKRNGLCPFTHHWEAEYDPVQHCYYLEPGEWCQDGCPKVTRCAEWFFESGYMEQLIDAQEDSDGSVSEESEE